MLAQPHGSLTKLYSSNRAYDSRRASSAPSNFFLSSAVGNCNVNLTSVIYSQ
jgi:hypothetical protein